MAIFSIISHICEIASRKLKYACCTQTKAKGISFYLFLLSTQGHCFHGDSLMASFASLFLINFFTPPFISAISLSEDRSWPLWVWLPDSPPTVLHFLSLPPLSLSLSHWKTKWKIKVSKTKGETMFWWSINDATSKCVCVFFSDKNETEQGSLQYQRPLLPVRCCCSESGKASCCFVISFPLLVCKWTADTDWWAITHLVLFCCRFLAASLILLVPFALVWQGHTTLQSSLVCLFICINRWTISTRAPVTLAWWQGNTILSGRRSLLG